MGTIKNNASPFYEDMEGFIYDGNESEINRIEEYGNDEYNFYPDAAFQITQFSQILFKLRAYGGDKITAIGFP